MRTPLARRTALLTALLVFSTGLALAAETRFEASAVVEPGGGVSEVRGFELDAGFGLGLGFFFSDAWALEIRALVSRGEITDAATYNVGLRRHFGEEIGWSSFFQFGVAYQNVEFDDFVACLDAECRRTTNGANDPGLYAGFGLDWNFSEHLGLRFDGRVASYDSDIETSDDYEVDLTAGLVLRF